MKDGRLLERFDSAGMPSAELALRYQRAVAVK
jgi:hypothetical protein